MNIFLLYGSNGGPTRAHPRQKPSPEHPVPGFPGFPRKNTRSSKREFHRGLNRAVAGDLSVLCWAITPTDANKRERRARASNVHGDNPTPNPWPPGFSELPRKTPEVPGKGTAMEHNARAPAAPSREPPSKMRECKNGQKSQSTAGDACARVLFMTVTKPRVAPRNTGGPEAVCRDGRHTTCLRMVRIKRQQVHNRKRKTTDRHSSFPVPSAREIHDGNRSRGHQSPGSPGLPRKTLGAPGPAPDT